MKRFPLKSVRRVGTALVIVPAVVIAGATCTNLTETPHNALTPSNAFQTPQELLAGVAGIYATLRGQDNNVGYFSIEEVPTDQEIIPTRGSDWFDNGQWLELHRQTWTPNGAAAGTFFNGEWNDLFGAVAKENFMLSVVAQGGGCNATTLSGCAQKSADTTIAELRTLRVWDYYMLQNMFGGLPLVTAYPTPGPQPRATRDSIFRFMESELLAAVPNLPAKWPAQFYGRITQGAANAILASLYINAGVFDKDVGPGPASGKVNATSYNSCHGITVKGGDACSAAIAAANAVINSGVYTLNPNWFQNFGLTNKSSPENIFVVEHSKDQTIGGNWPMRTLHYNQLSTGWGSPWNGFAATAETFNAFPASDERRGMWLFGQAFSFETGKPVTDRNGNNLVFTTAIPDATVATEGVGVRFNKFPPLPDAPSGNGHPNDFTIFRLAEMYLIKAEAENEAGQIGAALADLAVIHDRHDPTNPVAGMLLTSQQQIRDAILHERLLEFSAEGKRRADLIRHGKYLTWTEASKNGVSPNPRDQHLIVFPIPAPQLASNNKLVQNAGY